MKILTLLLALLLTTAASAQGTVQWNTTALATANTSKTGASGTVAWVYRNDEATPQYVDRLQVQAAGSNAATALRIFINNGEPNANAENNVLFEEVTLSSTTTSETAEVASVSVDLNIYVPPGYRIFTAIGTAGTAGWRFTAITKTPETITE